MQSRATVIRTILANLKGCSASTVYFSWPMLTVQLDLKGTRIVKAAPVVRRFEGHDIEALVSWALAKVRRPDHRPDDLLMRRRQATLLRMF